MNKILIPLLLIGLSVNSQDILKEMGQDVYISIKYNSSKDLNKWLPDKKEYFKILQSQSGAQYLKKYDFESKFNSYQKTFAHSVNMMHNKAVENGINWDNTRILSIITSFDYANNLDTIKPEYRRKVIEIYLWCSGHHYSMLFGPVKEFEDGVKLISPNFVLIERKSIPLYRTDE